MDAPPFFKQSRGFFNNLLGEADKYSLIIYPTYTSINSFSFTSNSLSVSVMNLSVSF